MTPFGRSSQPAPGPRTAEDRERARQEREARRAAREGRDPLPPPAPVDDGTGGPAQAGEPAPAAPAAESMHAEPDHVAQEAPAYEEPAYEEPAPVEEPPAFEQRAPAVEEPAYDEPAPVAEAPAYEEPAPAEEPPAYEEPAPAEEPPAYEEPAPAEEPPAYEQPVPAEEPPGPEHSAPDEPAAVAEDPEPAHAVADAPSPQEEDDAVVAKGGEMGEPRGSTSWFDDPAPTRSGASIAPDAGPPTVEWDADRALAEEHEPRVTRRTAAVSAGSTPAARAAAARAAGPRYGDEHERPVPPKRVNRAARTLPPTPPPPGGRHPRTRRRGRRIAVVLVLLLIIVGAALLYNALFQPFAGDGGRQVSVQVPQQSTASDIGQLLENEGVVASSTFFGLRSRLEGKDLKAGTYALRRDMSYGDAIKALAAGPKAAPTMNVTIPEGRSRRETNPRVREAGLRGSYLQASERQKSFNPRRYGAPRDVSSLEGFLFPSTYELRPGATSRQLVRKQLAAFRENLAKVSMRRARARNLDTYDVLIIASMVEREASLPKERPLVASVIYNRLREGMPLGIDATTRFAVQNWTRPLRVSELETDSPYNTRKRTGLPPGPIGSPGLSSIRAAANPARSDYLFYVVKPSGDGAHSFSSTDAEFQRDVAAYNRERERRGGQDPSSSDGG